MQKIVQMQLTESRRSHYVGGAVQHEFVFQPSIGFIETRSSYFALYPTDPMEVAYYQEHLGETFMLTLTPRSAKAIEEEEKAAVEGEKNKAKAISSLPQPPSVSLPAEVTGTRSFDRMSAIRYEGDAWNIMGEPRL